MDDLINVFMMGDVLTPRSIAVVIITALAINLVGMIIQIGRGGMK